MCDHHTIDDQNVNDFLTNLFTPKNDQNCCKKIKKDKYEVLHFECELLIQENASSRNVIFLSSIVQNDRTSPLNNHY